MSESPVSGTNPAQEAGESAVPDAGEPQAPVQEGAQASAATVPQPRVTEPTQEELDDLPADRRLELLELQRQRTDVEHERRRQILHQWINSVVLLIGALLAGGSLIATAQTLRTGQEELRTARDNITIAQQGQVTDRYTKAIEQLGSDQPEVRLGGIYALERLMADSVRDHSTILEVLASYIRVHAQDKPPAGSDTSRLAVDVTAALIVVSRRDHTRDQERFSLHLTEVDLHGKNLGGMNLRGANLIEANLRGANLRGADLRGANLYGANLNDASLNKADLSGAGLIGVDLRGADLSDANLYGATLSVADLRGAKLYEANLGGATLTGAKLTGAKLYRATLTGANLTWADLDGANLDSANLSGAKLLGTDLRGADLYGANLTGADLDGADLRGVQRLSEEEIRAAARVDESTQFGPLPGS